MPRMMSRKDSFSCQKMLFPMRQYYYWSMEPPMRRRDAGISSKYTNCTSTTDVSLQKWDITLTIRLQWLRQEVVISFRLRIYLCDVWCPQQSHQRRAGWRLADALHRVRSQTEFWRRRFEPEPEQIKGRRILRGGTHTSEYVNERWCDTKCLVFR